nr:RNA-dependent RNA polymerase [Callicarpa mosaic-associated virus 1]
MESGLKNYISTESKKAKDKYIEDYYNTIRDLDKDDSFLSLFDEFMNLIGRSRKYTSLLSKNKVSEKVYHERFVGDLDNVLKLYPIGQRLLHTPPNKYHLDFVYTLISLLEMSRHDILIEIIKEELKSYKFLDQDFKLSDYYSEIPTNRTPDILFYDPVSGKKITIEVKVTVSTDLNSYYEKYKKFVGQDYVVVLNYNLNGFTQIGDLKLDLNSMISNPMVETLNDFIVLSSDLRSKYKTIPESIYFSRINNEISEDSDLITGFKTRVESLDSYEEFKSTFGDDIWNRIEHDITNLSLITNKDITEECMNHIQDTASIYCQSKIDEFDRLFKENREQGLYTQTALHIHDYAKLQDDKARLTYDFTEKYKPSIYIPIIPGFNIGTRSRCDFYLDVFKKLKLGGVDGYSRAVIKLCKDLFSDDVLKHMLEEKKEIRDIKLKNANNCKKESNTTKIKEEAVTFHKTYCDLRVNDNNSFSISSDQSKMMKDSIVGYAPKLKNKKKDCLSFIQSSRDIIEVSELLNKLYDNSYDNKIYSGDLDGINKDTVFSYRYDNNIRGKFFDYLFNNHIAIKNLIGLNTVSSKKFRLIQTKDPATVLIMLPNSDALSNNAPLRFFSITIMERDQDCDNVFKLNKKLGIAHDMVNSGSYNIIISKVISLELNRLKLLSNGFAKYAQLISYYSNLSNNISFDTRMLAFLSVSLVTISSLSITENFKNFMMVCYSTFSNPDELINDKLECRPTTFTHIYIMNKIFSAIKESPQQRATILTSLKKTKVNDNNELVDTGFDLKEALRLPLSKIKVYNPKELLQESYLLFYLGNKGLHGSPQELLNLYHTPIEFERAYSKFLKENNGLAVQTEEFKDKGFDYESMRISSMLTYSKLRNEAESIRISIKQELGLDESILSKSQFSSTKSMAAIGGDKLNIKSLDKITGLSTLESYIKNSDVTNAEQFVIDTNRFILEFNEKKTRGNKVKAKIYGEVYDVIDKNVQMLPEIAIKEINKFKFIIFKDFKKKFVHPTNIDVIHQHSVKVFDNVIKECDNTGFKNLRDFYESNYIDSNDIIIRIFYKDQRSFHDREIYTGNLCCRLCLYPIESLFKVINKHIPQEAISITGEKKHKKMYDQRLDMLKKRKNYNRENVYKTDIQSMSCDASKWSASDMMQKFIIPISTNIFLTPQEKWFYIYLLIKYYKKYIVLTDSALFDAIRFHKVGSSEKIFEELTDNYSKNYQIVRSNWLQGNFNSTSSFVHCCSANLAQIMMDCLNNKYDMSNYMDFMCHSDDSCYDFLIMKKNEYYLTDKFVGTFLYTLIQWSSLKHCIRINRKKTYISNFYKEFLSTLIVGNELFYFYVADLLPISSDVTYDSPMDDLASFSGYINNAFMHATPMGLLETTICLINHLILATYNLNASSEKSPYKALLGDDKEFEDVPIQILSRYKVPLSFAGLVPYYSGDALKILHRIIHKLNLNLDRNNDIPFCELFDKELISKYMSLEDSPQYRNYIKMCLLTTNEDYLSKNQEDPYTLFEMDVAKQNLLSVVPNTNKSKLSPSYTYSEFKKDESYYKKCDILNPMWCLSNPTEHNDLRDRLISNYTNRKFIQSLMFSRPQLDYARRIINSNSKMYRYNLDNKDELLSIKTIYDKVRFDSIAYKLTSDSLINYLNIHLFTDQQVASAIHLYYSKEPTIMIQKDRANYRIVIPRTIYQPEYGRYSNTVLMNDLIVNNKCLKVEKIDQKAETMIAMSELQLNKLSKIIKQYEYPEDIDEDFKRFIDCKYKSVTNYNDFLIKPQDLGDFSIRVYKIKVLFQGLQIKHFKDMMNTLENNDSDYNIDYITPKSFLMTLNSFMLRDRVTSKLFIGTKVSKDINEYMLNRFGMYRHPDFIVNFKVNYKLQMSVNNLSYKYNVQKKVHDDMLYLSLIKSKCNDVTWNDILMNGHIGNEKVHMYLSYAANTSNDIHKSLFLKKCGYITDTATMVSLSNTGYIMNYWIQPTSDDNPFSEVVYHLHGYFLRVHTTRNGNIYYVRMNLFKPNYISAERRRGHREIVSKLLNRFRTDFKTILPNLRGIIKRETDNTVYHKGMTVTMDYDPTYMKLCEMPVTYYNTIDVEHLTEENGYMLHMSNTRIRRHEPLISFRIIERSHIDDAKLYDYVIEYRHLQSYSDICLSTGICLRDNKFFASEYTYLESEAIRAILDKRRVFKKVTNFNEEHIAQLYKLITFRDYIEHGFFNSLVKISECLALEAYMNDVEVDYDEDIDIDKIMYKLKTILRIDDDVEMNIYRHFYHEEPPYIHLFSICLDIEGISSQEFILIFIRMLICEYHKIPVEGDIEFVI